MSRKDATRLGDIVEALDAIRDHLTRGGLDDGLVYDAIRVRLIEIGEAVKGIDPGVFDDVVGVPWKEIARSGTTLRTDTSTPTTRSCKTSSTMTSTRLPMRCNRSSIGSTGTMPRARDRGNGHLALRSQMEPTREWERLTPAPVGPSDKLRTC